MQTDSSHRPKEGAGRERLMSLDALRGFTMFWVIGGDSIGHVLSGAKPAGLLGVLSTPLEFPIIKKLWTSSYVLLAVGFCWFLHRRRLYLRL